MPGDQSNNQGGNSTSRLQTSGLVSAEGVRDKVYKDTEGFRTIGIGFNMDSPNAKKVWQMAGIPTNFDKARAGKAKLSKDEINQLAETSFQIAEEDAKKVFPDFDKLSENRQNALLQLSYQLGGSKLAEFKQALGHLRSGQYELAAKQLLNSKMARQTPSRAQKIAAMIRNDQPYTA